MLLKRMNFIIVILFKFGASIGRYSGRIDNAKFKLKGKEYQLEKQWRTSFTWWMSWFGQ